MQQEEPIYGSPGITQPTIAADKDTNQSINEISKSSCQEPKNSIHVKKEEPELDSIENLYKRRKTDASNIKSSPSMPEKRTSEDPDGTLGLWRGNDVGQEAKELLEDIDHRYPNTFKSVQIRAKPTWLTILKDLHDTIKRFMGTPVDALNEQQVTGFHEDLKELEGFGFDLSWARKRLYMVDRLKFGYEPLQEELLVLEESLMAVEERARGRLKQLMEAHEMWDKARLECDNVKNARDKKAEEMANKFGAEYNRILEGHLGFGMLPGY